MIAISLEVIRAIEEKMRNALDYILPANRQSLEHRDAFLKLMDERGIKLPYLEEVPRNTYQWANDLCQAMMRSDMPTTAKLLEILPEELETFNFLCHFRERVSQEFQKRKMSEQDRRRHSDEIASWAGIPLEGFYHWMLEGEFHPHH